MQEVPQPAFFGAFDRHNLGDILLGHVAAAECGDDATLAAFSRGLDHVGLPVVLFRAGVAPWHDALEPYRRLAARSELPMQVFESLDVWHICALIAGSHGYICTSLQVVSSPKRSVCRR